MKQRTLGESCKHVEEMKVSWTSWSCVIGRVNKMEKEKSPTCAWSKRFEKV